jgi:uncharacterized protein
MTRACRDPDARPGLRREEVRRAGVDSLPARREGQVSSDEVQATMDSVKRARRGLAIFFAVLIAASVPLYVDIARNGLEPSAFIPLVYVPAFASIVARLALREGFADVSFRLDRRSVWPMLLGLMYPIAVATPAYAIAWSTGIARFAPAAVHPLGFPIPGDTPSERILASAIIAVTVGPLAMAVLALGEEIGWRGYMLTRLIEARVPQPVLVSGLVWGLWHAPMILNGKYIETSRPLVTCLLFVVTVSGSGWLAARLRLETGSIWPPVVMHASWNATVVSFFGASTQGDPETLWIGEGGVLVALSTTAVTAMFLRLWRGPTDGVPSERSSQQLGTVRL